MGTGLIVYNSSNIIQIDQDYKNYFYKYKFTRANLTTNQTLVIMTAVMSPADFGGLPDSPYNLGYSAYIDVDAQSPFVALRIGAAHATGAYGVQYMASTQIGSERWRLWFIYSAGCEFTLYVLDSLSPNETTKVGFTVYRADGSITFDAGWKVARVASVSSFDAGGREYAFAPSGYGFYQVDWEESGSIDYDGTSAHAQCIARKPDGTVGECTIPVFFYSEESVPGTNLPYMNPYQIYGGMFLDVTNV
ncbi:hypothetical protein O3297_10720 [Janthinobacterium sp. SUN128]|uniref:hypothetical protein n=1 Tax=Janthinobacterium sp. SUN128 TaxID=3014790 RepID=UPI0027127A7E|nr:hypothetical protein [Janthinobacterium sp. SUN128]MDO8033890.1 hypothetical protein [Janthinobacterium sp. SUN128]